MRLAVDRGAFDCHKQRGGAGTPIASAPLMRAGSASSILVLAALSLAACGEEEDATTVDTEWEPDRKPGPPEVWPDRPPERGPCAPHRVELHDGFVISIPVECVEEWIDRGDPPPSEMDDRLNGVNPSEGYVWEA